MSLNKKDTKKLKNVLHTNSHALHVLAKIYHGHRPSMIAEQLHITAQNVNYYTTMLVNLELIMKIGDRKGIAWKVTARGLFILKQLLKGGVNTDDFGYDHKIPVRLHNLCFSFAIHSSLESLRIRWIEMKNGVSKHTMTARAEQDYTVILVKSPNKGNSSMQIHMHKAYTFNPYQEIIIQYEAARTAAVLAAQVLRIEISITGKLVTTPHIAFEKDLIALYLATFGTASSKTKNDKGSSWVDSSHGFGEMETDDPNYFYKYLTMPENVYENSKNIRAIKEKLTRYKMHYDPVVTDNN